MYEPYGPSVSRSKGIKQGQGPYATALKKVEGDIKEVQKRINEKLGVSFAPMVECLADEPNCRR